MSEPQTIEVTCQYFALCDRPAEGVVEHPVLEYVPTCGRCAEKMGQTLIPADFYPEV